MENVHCGDVRRNPSSSFQESYPSGVTQDIFNSSSKELCQYCEMLSTRYAHQRFHDQCFKQVLVTQVLLRRSTWKKWVLLSKYQLHYFRLPKVNQVFNINRIAYTNCLGIVSHIYQLRLVRKVKVKVPGLYIPWNSPGQYTGMSSLSLLQGIFPTQGSNPSLPYLRRILYQFEPQGRAKHTGEGSLSLLQRIFLTQESNQGLLHCRQTLYQLSYQERTCENSSKIQSLETSQVPIPQVSLSKENSFKHTKFIIFCPVCERSTVSLKNVQQLCNVALPSDVKFYS